VIRVAFPLLDVKFAGAGCALYASLRYDERTKLEQMPGLARIDFNPMRSTLVTGTKGFSIRDFAVSQDQCKIVVSGSHQEEGRLKCGLFEITVSTGVARQVLAADCNYRWSWADLTVSPDGSRAVASYGNTHTDHNYRLDLIDVVHGTARSLGDLSRPTWSPDGKWIAAIEWSRRRLICSTRMIPRVGAISALQSTQRGRPIPAICSFGHIAF
jgi:Tol biopolymer transport system component